MPISNTEESREYQRLWAKSLKQYPKRLYKGLERRAKLKDLELLFNRVQLERWLFSSPLYAELHAIWKDSGFEQRLAPSIVILDKTQNYTLKNIEILPFHISSTRGGNTIESQTTLEQHRNELANKVKCIETGEIFSSQAEAARLLKLPKDGLRKYFKGVQKTVGGFTFKKIN